MFSKGWTRTTQRRKVSSGKEVEGSSHLKRLDQLRGSLRVLSSEDGTIIELSLEVVENPGSELEKV